MKFYSAKAHLYKTNYFNVEIPITTDPCRISVFPFKIVKELRSTRVEKSVINKPYVTERLLISIIPRPWFVAHCCMWFAAVSLAFQT